MEWILGLVWFMGQGPVTGALIIGFFWSALAHPERIRNHTEFRLGALCLGASFVLNVVIPVIVIASASDGGRSERRDTHLAVLYAFVFPPILTTLALLLGLDSVTARRATPSARQEEK